MITFMESKETSKEGDKCLDSDLWHACAGSMVQTPPENSKVLYFPQGHFEHVSANLDFNNRPTFPPYIPCKVSAVKLMAEPETDEVFARIRLVPILGNNNLDLDKDGSSDINTSENQDKPTAFAKTLTQSDANNGGGFSVPRYCAETIFSPLDYSAVPPVQTILVKDVHGEVWKFRHIYRGTPRRHLLTTGWSAFVNHKKLVAGDSIVFLRAENGDLCVGIRRAKNGIGGGVEAPPLWNAYSMFVREDERKLSGNGRRGRVKMEDVIEAASLASNGKAFDVVYYPRAGTPEFCVKASLVKEALRIRWCSGMRFKMAFETEDSSRVSWFMGTISLVQVADHVHWPNSPWRLLQVQWDEPDLLQNVKRVNPWLIELVSNVPNIHFSPFSPPHKKMRLPHSLLDVHPPLPAFNHHHFRSSYPFGCLSDNAPAGMQGARHGPYPITQPNLLFTKHLHALGQASQPNKPSICISNNSRRDEKNISSLLSLAQESTKPDSVKEGRFMLFGQQILTEKQICMSSSSDTNFSTHQETSNGSPLGEEFQSELASETGHCKVFMESEEVGRTVDLSLLGSYEELHQRLASMFHVEISEISNHIVYKDTAGAVRQTGEESFSKFMKTATRLRVVGDSSSESVGV